MYKKEFYNKCPESAAQWQCALMPCSKKVLSLNSSLGSLCMEFSCSPCACIGFPHSPKTKHDCWVNWSFYSNLSLGMSVCSHGCMSCDGLVTVPGYTPPHTQCLVEIDTSPPLQPCIK